MRRRAAPDLTGPDMELAIPASSIVLLVAVVQRHRVVCSALTVDARSIPMSIDPVPGYADDVFFTLQRRDLRWMALFARGLVMSALGGPGGGMLEILQMLEQNAMHARWLGWGKDAVPVPLLTDATARTVRIHAGRHGVESDALWTAMSWYVIGAMMAEYGLEAARAIVDRDAS